MVSTIHLATCLVFFVALFGPEPAMSTAIVRRGRGLRASTTTRLLTAEEQRCGDPQRRQERRRPAELGPPTAAGRCGPARVASKVTFAAACAGLAGVLAAPHAALASAQESLDLLDGYQALTPVWVTWTVLLGGGVWLYFRVFKFLASF